MHVICMNNLSLRDECVREWELQRKLGRGCSDAVAVNGITEIHGHGVGEDGLSNLVHRFTSNIARCLLP